MYNHKKLITYLEFEPELVSVKGDRYDISSTQMRRSLVYIEQPLAGSNKKLGKKKKRENNPGIEKEKAEVSA